MKLLHMAAIGRELGVSRNQVWTWYQRRERNGFPMPEGTIRIQYGRGISRIVEAWDLEVVQDWFRSYVPAVGGRRRAS